ncbi:MAG: PAS domain-containing protein [bacterium]|nr:PAS domain-containing protein [bacterium]
MTGPRRRAGGGKEGEAVLRTFPDVLYVLDPEGRFTFVSDAVRQWGYEPAELLGRHFADLFHPDDVGAVSRAIALRRLEGRATGDLHAPKLFDERRTGARITRNLEARLLLKGPGRPAHRAAEIQSWGWWDRDVRRDGKRFLGSIGSIRNLDGERRTEAALRESRRALSTLIGNLPGIAYRCRNDRDWTMEFISDGCRDLIGHPPEELVLNRAVSFGSLIHPDDRAGVWDGVQAAVAGRRPFTLTYRIRTAGGGEKWVWEQGTPVYSPAGELLALEGFICDITERKHREEDLIRAQRAEAIGVLAGGVAHDFNNILAGIMGYTQLMQADAPAGSRIASDIGSVQRLLKRAAALTGKLLAFSRRDAYHPMPVAVNRIVEETLDVLSHTAGRGVTMRPLLSPSDPIVLGDEGEVHQVVMNLCMNACEAMPDGGTLTVRTGEIDGRPAADAGGRMAEGRYVMLSVADTGVGISPRDAERIFEPFYTTEAKRHGTGLGLPVVKQIVERARGSVAFESRPGGGTVFTVRLPAAPRGAEAPPPPPVAGAGRGWRVLVVDDEEDCRRSVGRYLADAGCQVVEAASGGEAVRIVETRGTDLDIVLLDIVMEGMSGVDALGRIRSIRPSLPVILCTGCLPEEATGSLRHSGADGFIRKPFDFTGLTALISRTIAARGR